MKCGIESAAASISPALIGGAAFIYTSPERQNRVTEYVTHITDINNREFETSEGYQAQQAHIAIAQGKLFGVGIGKSTQRVLRLLGELHSGRSPVAVGMQRIPDLSHHFRRVQGRFQRNTCQEFFIF